jgi:hypothetical protein
VTQTYIDLRFTDVHGQRHIVYAGRRENGVWDVRGIVRGRQFSRECDRWQAVERTVFWLSRHAHEPAPTLAGRGRAVAAAIVVMTLLGAGAAFAGRQPDASPAIQSFVAATREYAALHRRIEATLPRLDVSSNPDTIFRLVQQMSAAMRNARPDARAGDFFTDAVAVELRARIAHALAAHDFSAQDVRQAEVLEGIVASNVLLKVNGTFPWIYATAMFPCVMDALPALPPELQYRIVGDTLVLIDVHAGLIVDLLPHALIETER